MPGRELRPLARRARGDGSRPNAVWSRVALTARGIDRVLRVAWTVADLKGTTGPTKRTCSPSPCNCVQVVHEGAAMQPSGHWHDRARNHPGDESHARASASPG
ncbi:hypothetical protein ACRAWF_04755 [Streptomyces sp. L7]